MWYEHRIREMKKFIWRFSKKKNFKMVQSWNFKTLVTKIPLKYLVKHKTVYIIYIIYFENYDF